MSDVGERPMKRMERELAYAPRLTEDEYREILVRLPVKVVVRCGTVCKAWRRITMHPDFLAENARHQPAEVLLYRYVYRQQPRPNWRLSTRWVHDVVLDAILVSVGKGGEDSRRSLIRYPKPHNGGMLLLAVSDGVFLFKKADGRCVLCNPTTRMWADLPALPQLLPPLENEHAGEREFGFYFHQPSTEFRLLCRRDSSVIGTWCILPTGEAQPRNIDTTAAEAAGINALVPYLSKAATTPLALHGSLHWPPQPGSIAGQTEMAVFDILSETFSQMEGPPTPTGADLKLFSMDGLLVVADLSKKVHIDLWFLEKYGDAASWKPRHRVATPWAPLDNYGTPVSMLGVAAAVDEEGNVIFAGRNVLAVYNVKKKKMVKTSNSVETPDNENVVVSRHVFKANLVQHPNFSTRSTADLPFVHF